MATQFGGGKTHSLTLLYHLAGWTEGERWQGVRTILATGQVETVPKAATAVFVGPKFDSFTGGRRRRHPAAERPGARSPFSSAAEGFDRRRRHDEERIAPAAT